MEDLSLHILDIVENSLRAKAKNVEIRLVHDERTDTLVLEIVDDGEGLDEGALEHVTDPFYTTKQGKRTGLGLAFLAQAAEEAEGNLRVESQKGHGTRVIASFQMGHVDRKPLGNLDETLKCLKATHPDVNFRYEFRHEKDE